MMIRVGANRRRAEKMVRLRGERAALGGEQQLRVKQRRRKPEDSEEDSEVEKSAEDLHPHEKRLDGGSSDSQRERRASSVRGSTLSASRCREDGKFVRRREHEKTKTRPRLVPRQTVAENSERPQKMDRRSRFLHICPVTAVR